MIHNEDFPCAFKILELRAKVFDLNLKQIEQGYYGQKKLGISQPTKYKFNPKDYPEYEHTMTHQEESGIEDYSKFATYEFRI